MFYLHNKVNYYNYKEVIILLYLKFLYLIIVMLYLNYVILYLESLLELKKLNKGFNV